MMFKDESADIFLGLFFWEKSRSCKDTKARIHYLFLL